MYKSIVCCSRVSWSVTIPIICKWKCPHYSLGTRNIKLESTLKNMLQNFQNGHNIRGSVCINLLFVISICINIISLILPANQFKTCTRNVMIELIKIGTILVEYFLFKCLRWKKNINVFLTNIIINVSIFEYRYQYLDNICLLFLLKVNKSSQIKQPKPKPRTSV